MKIEKINENKIKITLTIEELNERKISIEDITDNEDKAKKLFVDLIEESYLDETFVMDHAELFVEATTDNKNFFSVTITKLNEKKDITKFTSPTKFIVKNIFFFNN
ncbi:MAG: adaptor protein MecA, partial [Clostridia bacterium]